MVFYETKIDVISVKSIIYVISYSDANYTGMGTIAIESEQQASSLMNHSNLFSENMPINFISGVPST